MADKKGPPQVGGADKFRKHIRRIVTSVEYVTTTPFVDFSHEERQFAKLCPTIAWHLSNTLTYGPLADISSLKPRDVEAAIRQAIQDVVGRSSIAESGLQRYFSAIEKLSVQFALSDKDPDAEYITLEYTILKQYDLARSAWARGEEMNKLIFLTASTVLAARVFKGSLNSFEEKYVAYIFKSSIAGSSKIAKGYFPKKGEE